MLLRLYGSSRRKNNDYNFQSLLKILCKIKYVVYILCITLGINPLKTKHICFI
jgi:hypothetical protein